MRTSPAQRLEEADWRNGHPSYSIVKAMVVDAVIEDDEWSVPITVTV